MFCDRLLTSFWLPELQDGYQEELWRSFMEWIRGTRSDRNGVGVAVRSLWLLTLPLMDTRNSAVHSNSLEASLEVARLGCLLPIAAKRERQTGRTLGWPSFPRLLAWLPGLA